MIGKHFMVLVWIITVLYGRATMEQNWWCFVLIWLIIAGLAIYFLILYMYSPLPYAANSPTQMVYTQCNFCKSHFTWQMWSCIMTRCAHLDCSTRSLWAPWNTEEHYYKFQLHFNICIPYSKNIDGKKTLANYSISSSFSTIFTISITFPMQMNFNSPKFFFHQTFYNPYLPKFFTAKVFTVRYIK